MMLSGLCWRQTGGGRATLTYRTYRSNYMMFLSSVCGVQLVAIIQHLGGKMKILSAHRVAIRFVAQFPTIRRHLSECDRPRGWWW